MRVELKILDIDSSLIDRLEFLWDKDESWGLTNTGHIRVTFQNGARYIYENVSFALLMAVASSDSVGQAFNDSIKNGKFKYYKD
tara:strand:- start:2395 stop:2646 length:252 start_codon:yes stop_codon:yes gene_type:complete